MRGLRLKRGETSVLAMVIAVAILLVVGYIILSRFGITSTLLGNAASCEKKSGSCVDASTGCSSAEGNYQDFGSSCSDKAKICCLPLAGSSASDTARFTAAERTALANPIFLTSKTSPAALTELNLEEGKTFDSLIKFNDKLPADDIGPIIVYVSDSKSDEFSTNMYFYTNQPSIPKTTLTSDPPVFRGGVTSKGVVQGISSEGQNNFVPGGATISLDFKPRLKDVYQKLTVHVVVLDAKKLSCRGETGEEWETCMEQENNPPFIFDPKDDAMRAELESIMTDQSYWLAGKTYQIKIKPILELSGVSTTWVAEDTLTVKTNDNEYGNLNFRLINAYGMQGSFNQVIDTCENEDLSNPPKEATLYINQITNIVGTTTDTKGIPLNLNIGGFRVPTSSVQLKYVTQASNPKFANGKADIKIDKATMIKDFYEPSKDKGISMDELFSGSNAFLCVRAEKLAPDGKTTIVAHAVSQSPLKVDILPPYLEQEDIRIVYPELKINTSEYSAQYPSISSQSAFYTNYPKVVIPCQDFGQSGCASYDYYLKTGNYINVNVNSNDWQDIVTGASLQLGLNLLFDYFAKIDPEKTICPYIYSNEFRLNKNPSITLRTDGQGIICIRVKDSVGNAKLYWKEIYSPKQLIERVALETSNDLVSNAANG